jgi:ABC-type iron transport system FetAB ATPase subunit
MDKILHYINLNKTIYVHGKSGCGKTTLLKQLPFDVKFISIQDVSTYDDIVVFAQPSILQKMSLNISKQVCVIDNIDFLQTNDKKILTALLKQFKFEEKNKKKRNFTLILCGTNYYDKKIKEIFKFCNVVHINTNNNLLYNNYEKNIQNNIKKIMTKSFDQDFIIESEKATQSLLFHENIIDLIQTKDDIIFYKQFLTNFCIGDYFDRISFQKQLWIFNEMTYYFKILHNYYLYKNTDLKPKKNTEFRFTKVLTKYSNEYNNNSFIISLCNQLRCSKKELYYSLLNGTANLTLIEINRAKNYFQIK